MDQERDQLSEAAQTLSESGAAKGGKARAEALSSEERKAIARRAAEARWGTSKLPRETHSGIWKFRDMEIPCAVLEDKTRVLSRIGFLKAIGRKGKAKGGRQYDQEFKTPVFLTAANLKPFISDELIENSAPIVYKPKLGGTAYGYRATILPEVCNVFLDAKDADALLPNQIHIAERCKLLLRGFATVGILAVIDEVTGFQADRDRDELNKILEAYISKELLPWTERFPTEFFRQLYKVQGWDYREGNHRRYRVVGKLINKYIYEPMPPGVLHELKRKNPPNEKGYRQFKHHQFLTPETGNEHLNKQLLEVTTLMRVADSPEEFKKLFVRAFPKRPKETPQQRLDYDGSEVT